MFGQTDQVTGGVEMAIRYDNTDFMTHPSRGSRQKLQVTRDWGGFGSSNPWTTVEFEWCTGSSKLDPRDRRRIVNKNDTLEGRTKLVSDGRTSIFRGSIGDRHAGTHFGLPPSRTWGQAMLRVGVKRSEDAVGRQGTSPRRRASPVRRDLSKLAAMRTWSPRAIESSVRSVAFGKRAESLCTPHPASARRGHHAADARCTAHEEPEFRPQPISSQGHLDSPLPSLFIVRKNRSMIEMLPCLPTAP